MQAQRLEEIRALIADLYWEVSNNHRNMTGDDDKIAGNLCHALIMALSDLIDLRNSAREREARS